MDLTLLLAASLGAAFAASCFGAYAVRRAREGWFDWDIMAIAAVVVWLAVLVFLRPEWVW